MSVRINSPSVIGLEAVGHTQINHTMYGIYPRGTTSQTSATARKHHHDILQISRHSGCEAVVQLGGCNSSLCLSYRGSAAGTIKLATNNVPL